MAQVVATPEEIERFAQQLKQFNADLHTHLTTLQGQFYRLGDTWRDQEHARFAQEFEQTVRVLEHFRRASEQQIPFLQRKARRLRDYLGQR
jgi:uncharacterized protein YukE